MSFISLWLTFPIALIAVLIFWEIGYRFGHRTTQFEKPETGESITTLVSIIVGLVAFLLAFTFNMAEGRFQERRDVFIDDVNAIGTAYLRTDTIAEPERSNIRALMRQYVDERVEIASTNDLNEALKKAADLQNEMWQQTAIAAEKDRSPVVAIFVESMNQMFDMHTKRVTIMLQHRIPVSIWLALFALTALGIAAMGYQNGLLDRGRSPAVAIVALMFAIVIFMIADLDTPGRGAIYVDQQAMTDLRDSMK